MTIERIMRYLFSQELIYWNKLRYARDAEVNQESVALYYWYQDGYSLVSKIGEMTWTRQNKTNKNKWTA